MKFLIKFFSIFLLFLFLIPLNLKVSALEKERIKSFNVFYNINKNGTIDITEEITIVANQEIFKHGIYRDFFIQNLPGNKSRQSYIIKSANINNQKTKFSMEDLFEGVRFYFGDPEVILDPGDYTFKINYQAKNSESYFTDHEEIFWNINGEWNVEIDNISGIFVLPEGISEKDLKINGFIGSFGSKNPFTEYKLEGNKIYFKSLKPLNKYENISIAIWFQSGTFSGNSDFSNLESKVYYGLLLFLNLLTLFISIFIFKNNGVDQKILNAPVTYDIPKDVSPSEFRYILLNKVDYKSLSAEIINLAIKKFVKIEKTEDFKFVKMGKPVFTNKIEELVFNNLFPADNIEVTTNEIKDQDRFGKTLSKISSALVFKDNKFQLPKMFIFFLYTIIIFVFSLILRSNNFDEISSTFLYSFLALILFSFFYKFIIRKIKLTPSFFSYFSFVFSLGIIISYFYFVVPGSVHKYFLLTSIIPFIIYEFINSFDNFSEREVEIMTIVMGFKKFAETQKNYLLSVENEIPLTFNMYEKYLPYALAINIETLWSKKFSSVLESNSKLVSDNYYINNYSAIENSLNRNISSYNYRNYASQNSSRSGGFSSSSSSGGGGGSRGGGGW